MPDKKIIFMKLFKMQIIIDKNYSQYNEIPIQVLKIEYGTKE